MATRISEARILTCVGRIGEAPKHDARVRVDVAAEAALGAPRGDGAQKDVARDVHLRSRGRVATAIGVQLEQINPQ